MLTCTKHCGGFCRISLTANNLIALRQPDCSNRVGRAVGGCAATKGLPRRGGPLQEDRADAVRAMGQAGFVKTYRGCICFFGNQLRSYGWAPTVDIPETG